MSYDDIMGLPSHLRPMPNDTPSTANARKQFAAGVLEKLGMPGTGSPLETLESALFQAELRGQAIAGHRFQEITERDGTLIGGSDFELQRVLPLAKALLESGMDIDTLLARMMGLE